MVFVWSYLTEGDPACTLVQVAVNDLLMLVLFAPLVMFLCGVANVVVPPKVLLTSVVVFIVIPLAAGWLTRTILWKSRGPEWFERQFLPKFPPVMIAALLLTLVLIFAFQAENLTQRWLVVLLIAVPILIQVYFNAGLTYLLMWWFDVPHAVAAPGALIGASNFFELAVAVAITLFGPSSGAALATVVGVLVEVPGMLSVCRACRALVNGIGARLDITMLALRCRRLSKAKPERVLAYALPRGNSRGGRGVGSGAPTLQQITSLACQRSQCI